MEQSGYPTSENYRLKNFSTFVKSDAGVEPGLTLESTAPNLATRVAQKAAQHMTAGHGIRGNEGEMDRTPFFLHLPHVLANKAHEGRNRQEGESRVNCLDCQHRENCTDNGCRWIRTIDLSLIRIVTLSRTIRHNLRRRKDLRQTLYRNVAHHYTSNPLYVNHVVSLFCTGTYAKSCGFGKLASVQRCPELFATAKRTQPLRGGLQ